LLADEVLIDAARHRRRRDPTKREGIAALLTSGTFLAAAVAFAVFTSSPRSFHPVPAILLCLGLGVLTRFELELGSGSAVPTQLLFVPMLFLLPLRFVPLFVCLGFLVGGGIDLLHGKLRPQRAGVLIGCAWFSLLPALVLHLGGEKGPSWSRWPLYVAALAAQFAGDFAHTAVHERIAHHLKPHALAGAVARVYAFDALLSPVAFLSAVAAAEGDLGFLGLLPLVVVFSALARERAGRLDAALDAARHATLARTDTLTGIANRLAWNEQLAELVETPGAAPVAVCIIDLDRFKAYNDTYGHQAGDQVLVGIAICISDTVKRAGDCAARYGGEEFAVLLPGCAADEAMQVAETIRLKVAQWSDGPTVNTVSIGIASMVPVAAMEWQQLVEAADKALYAAKAGGRNRSVLATIPKLSLVA